MNLPCLPIYSWDNNKILHRSLSLSDNTNNYRRHSVQAQPGSCCTQTLLRPRLQEYISSWKHFLAIRNAPWTYRSYPLNWHWSNIPGYSPPSRFPRDHLTRETRNISTWKNHRKGLTCACARKHPASGYRTSRYSSSRTYPPMIYIPSIRFVHWYSPGMLPRILPKKWSWDKLTDSRSYPAKKRYVLWNSSRSRSGRYI